MLRGEGADEAQIKSLTSLLPSEVTHYLRGRPHVRQQMDMLCWALMADVLSRQPDADPVNLVAFARVAREAVSRVAELCVEMHVSN